MNDWLRVFDSHDPRTVGEIVVGRLLTRDRYPSVYFSTLELESTCQIGETRKVRLLMIAGDFGPPLWIGAIIVYLLIL